MMPIDLQTIVTIETLALTINDRGFSKGYSSHCTEFETQSTTSILFLL